MAGERSQCPEKLLAQDDPRELMGQRQRAEREALVSLPDDCRVKPHRPADQERRRTGVLEALGAPRGKRLAGRRSATIRCKRHDVGPIDHSATNAVSLPAEHLVPAALQWLGRNLVNTETDPLVDSALVLSGCVGVGRAHRADHDDLESWMPHGGVS
jgi:hypothetical protein